jgi:pyruvate formate lyase activating enzyme
MNVSQVMDEIKKDLAFYEESGGGVTFSGGEPLAQPEFLEALLKACREEELHTVLDTSGAASYRTLEAILPWVDMFLYDLKFMDQARHLRWVGSSNQIILENLEKIAQTGKQISIRVPVIPGINDDDENIAEIGRFAAGMTGVNHLTLLPYHETGLEKYALLEKESGLKQIRPLPRSRLEEMAQNLRRLGLEISTGGGDE